MVWNEEYPILRWPIKTMYSISTDAVSPRLIQYDKLEPGRFVVRHCQALRVKQSSPYF